jgi:hypothetical protein
VALIAAILFLLGLIFRLIDHATLHDPWVWALAGLLCLALAELVTLPWPARRG